MQGEVVQWSETFGAKAGRNTRIVGAGDYLRTIVTNAKACPADRVFPAFLLARPQSVTYPETTRYFPPDPSCPVWCFLFR
jgi:hypothetical protein